MMRINSFKMIALGAMLFLALAISLASIILIRNAAQTVSSSTSPTDSSHPLGFEMIIPIDWLGEPVTLERARQLAGIDFSPPTYLPPGAICEIRAREGQQGAALVYKVPRMSRIPFYTGDVQIVIGIRDDDTSFSLPPTSEPLQTVVVAEGNVTKTYTPSVYVEGPGIVQVDVGGNPGWGFDPTDFPSGRHVCGRLEWWRGRIHYSIVAELPLAEMIKVAESTT